jgi:hypothetical protein
MASRGFGDDDTTQPDTQHRGAPEAELDLKDAPPMAPPIADAVTAPAATAPIRPPVGKPASARPVRAEDAGLDAVWSIYESALRAWGKMTATGAPSDAEHAVVTGCAQLREYLQSLGTPRKTPDDERRAADEERRIALVAVKVKAAIADYETWNASRPR